MFTIVIEDNNTEVVCFNGREDNNIAVFSHNILLRELFLVHAVAIIGEYLFDLDLLWE